VSAAAEAERLLGRLVSFRSVAGEPNLDLVAWVADLLDGAGATVTEVPGTRSDARNLHAVLGPQDVPGVLLSGHTDVVSAEGQEWRMDPFTLTADGDRLYGRGTADMKGFVAAALAAMLAAPAGELRQPLHLALSSDEELGCTGVGPLLDLLETLPARPRYAIVGEPTQLDVAVAHKAKAAWRVNVRGRAAHSATTAAPVNAVAYAARMIVALDEIGHELAAGQRDERFSVPHATLGVGPIAGGVSLNIVPERCGFDFELRTLPGGSADETVQRIRAMAAELSSEMRHAAPEAGIEVVEGVAYPALEPDGSAAVARDVAALSGGVAGGAVDFGSEAGLFQRRLGIPVVVCGPGSMAQGHKPEEFVERAQLQRCVATLERLVERLA
jgi:acetylornithine deacetylase